MHILYTSLVRMFFPSSFCISFFLNIIIISIYFVPCGHRRKRVQIRYIFRSLEHVPNKHNIKLWKLKVEKRTSVRFLYQNLTFPIEYFICEYNIRFNLNSKNARNSLLFSFLLLLSSKYIYIL